MKAKITKAFKFSPDGNSVRDIAVGDVVEGRCAEVAVQSGWGEEEAAPAPAPVPVPPRVPLEEDEPVTEEHKAAKAPLDKAIHHSPYNKRK